VSVLPRCGVRDLPFYRPMRCMYSPEVLPDDKTEAPIGAARVDSTRELPPSVVRVRELKALLGTADAAETKKIQKELKEHTYRVPNQYFVQALDSALRAGLSLSLARFRQPRRPGPLGRSERRYFLPPDVSKACPLSSEDDHPDLQRSCLEDMDTGDRWLEVPLQADRMGKRMLPPALHLCIDRGSTGMPGAMWMFSKGGVNGTLHGDFCHDDWNGFHSACKASGVWLPILERVTVCNLPSGPWAGSKFFGSIKEAGTSFFRNYDYTHPLFVRMYPLICDEQCDHPAHEGTDAHMKEVWQRAAGSPCMRRKGLRVRCGRWFQLFIACDQKQGEFMVLHLILLFIGFRDGYWAAVPDAAAAKAKAGAAKGTAASQVPHRYKGRYP